MSTISEQARGYLIEVGNNFPDTKPLVDRLLEVPIDDNMVIIEVKRCFDTQGLFEIYPMLKRESEVSASIKDALKDQLNANPPNGISDATKKNLAELRDEFDPILNDIIDELLLFPINEQAALDAVWKCSDQKAVSALFDRAVKDEPAIPKSVEMAIYRRATGQE